MPWQEGALLPDDAPLILGNADRTKSEVKPMVMGVNSSRPNPLFYGIPTLPTYH